MASPMPFEPPVMSAVRPARLRSNFYLPYGRSRIRLKMMWSGFRRLGNTLLQLHAGGFDQGLPPGAVLGHERPDVREADLRRFESRLDHEAGAKVWVVDDRGEFPVEPCDNLGRRPYGRKKSRPRRGAKPWKARLREGRHIGQRRVAVVGAARRQRLEFAGIDLRFERAGREQRDVHFARSHRRENRRGAVEGNAPVTPLSHSMIKCESEPS